MALRRSATRHGDPRMPNEPWSACTGCSVLILRGEHSDLLLPETVVEMKRRGLAAERGCVESAEISNCGRAAALMADEHVRLIENFLLPDSVAGVPPRCAAAGGHRQ